MAEELFTCPPDLTLVSDADLSTLRDSATAEFDRINGTDTVITPEVLQYASRLADDLDSIKAELQVRSMRTDLTVTQAQQVAALDLAKLNERVHGPADPAAAPAGAPDVEAIAAAAARGTMQTLLTVMEGQRKGGSLNFRPATLAATAQQQPEAPRPTPTPLNVVSSVDIPNRSVAANGRIPSIEALTEAFQDRARGIPSTAMGKAAPRYSVARIMNEFPHTVDDRTSPAQMEALFRELTSGDKQTALLAGGGWCAPSEILYSFFNISDVPSGLVDMPTVGVSRGGIKYPVSPNISQMYYTSGASNAATGFGGFATPFANVSDPWLWSETDDILTVTGSINKPTLRVPCATFNETRLEAYGITLTAGNLTDSAYPEATQNFLRLLRNAYAHAINARLITLMTSACNVTVSALPGSGTTNAAFNTLLSGIELSAVDYRNKFGMSDSAVLEVVLPYWALAVIRADIAWRVNSGIEILSVSDQQIMQYFADRSVSVQFVSDWQVRGSSQFGNASSQMTAWPVTAQFMLYAAGSFVHGTGLSLDLGVVRDSILNAENDFTAAWAEEAHLVALVGHEARLYTAKFNVNGAGVLGLSNGTAVI